MRLLVVFFSFCLSFAIAQPANNNCSGAIALPVNSSCIETTGTTLSGSAGFNPVVQVFSGSCGSANVLSCSNSTGIGGAEIVNLNALVVGATYWFRVYHFEATAPTTPTFTVCITPQATMPSCSTSAPAGNTCADATLICDVNGYCGSTAASYTSDSWPSLNTAFCGSIENLITYRSKEKFYTEAR